MLQRLLKGNVGIGISKFGPTWRLIRRARMNVSEYVWQRLSEWGLRRVYGYPGDGVGGLDVALEKAKEYEDPPLAHGATHTGVGYAGPAKLPDEALLREAADVLNSGKKVAMLVGAGALEATDEVIAVAERLQAGVAKALLGKAALPDDLP